MPTTQYAIGVDFGTLSGRAVLVRFSDGAEIAEAVYDYSHGYCKVAWQPRPPRAKAQG